MTGRARIYWHAYANGRSELGLSADLAGGEHRQVGQWAFLDVHQITTTFIKTQLTYRTKYRVVNGKRRTTRKEDRRSQERRQLQDL